MSLSFLYCTENDVKAKLLGLDVSDIPDTLLTHLTDRYIPWAQREVDSFCSTNFDATATEEFYSGTGTTTLLLRHRPVREILNVTLNVIPSAQWFQFKRWFYTQTTDTTGIKIARQGGVDPINDAIDSESIPRDISYTFAPGLGFQNEDAVPANQTGDFNTDNTQYGNSDLFVDAAKGILTIPPAILFLEQAAVPFWNYSWLAGIGNIRVRYIYGYSNPTLPDALIDSETGNLPLEIIDATSSLAASYILKDKGIFMTSGATSVSVDGVSKNYGEIAYGGLIKYLEESAKRTLMRYRRIGAGSK